MSRSAIILSVFICMSVNTIAQTLSINNIDRSRWPIISGEIIPYDADGNRITNLNPSEWIVKENGIKCESISIECPKIFKSRPVSTVLALDVSGSMSFENRLKTSVNAAKAWITSMDSNSECAIVSFNQIASLSHYFTNNPTYISTSLDYLEPGGQEDFYKAFDLSINELNNSAKNNTQKIIVFLTDGTDTRDDDDIFEIWERNEIIDRAINHKIIIYSIAVGMECSDNLKMISNKTGGKWYSNIKSSDELTNLYLSILRTAQNNKPCKVTWKTKTDNDKLVKELRIISKKNDIDIKFGKQIIYDLLKTKPLGNTKHYDFGSIPVGSGSNIEITIKAIKDVNIKSIKKSGSEDFKISNLKLSAIKLNNGEEYKILLEFLPKSSERKSGQIEIELDNQTMYSVYIEGGGKTLTSLPIEPKKIKYIPQSFFHDGFAIVKNPDTQKFGFINKNGDLIIKCKYDKVIGFNHGYAPVKINDKWGLINKRGSIVIEPQYYEARPFSYGLWAVKIKSYNSEWMYIDINNLPKINEVFSSVMCFWGPYAIVKHQNGNQSMINTEGEEVNISAHSDFMTDFWFDWIFFLAKLYDIHSPDALMDDLHRDTTYKLTNARFGYSDSKMKIYPFNNQMALIKIDNQYGYINEEGKIVIEPTYEDAHFFSEGLACVELGDSYYFIDKNNQIKFEHVDDELTFFSDGLAYVRKHTISNGKHKHRVGYINKKGEWVIYSED